MTRLAFVLRSLTASLFLFLDHRLPLPLRLPLCLCLLRCHDSGFRDYQAGHSWQAEKLRFFQRKNIDPSTQFIDEGCYSWGMCKVLTKISERSCSYITVFREPKDRLVSAFVYCMYRQPKDQCCGWNRLHEADNYATMNHAEQQRARTATTIHQFARHWGSFGFRQFLINDPAINYDAIVGTSALLWPAWYAIGASVSALPRRPPDRPWTMMSQPPSAPPLCPLLSCRRTRVFAVVR
jgi:hypothetical protein